MHFDGARSKFEAGPFSFHLEFDCTNNMAKYEALLLGFKQREKM